MGGCGSSIRKQDPFTAPEDFYSNYSDKKGPFYVMDAKATKEIIFAKKGPGSKEFCPAMTVIELFNKAVAKARGKPAIRVERNYDQKGNWTTPEIKKIGPGVFKGEPAPWKEWTYGEYQRECNMAARALMSLGVEQFGTVAIYGFNSPEWFVAQMSAILCGAKSAGIYPSDRVENVVYKCKHSRAAVAIIEDEKKLAKFMPYEEKGATINPLDDLPELKTIVVWTPGREYPSTLKSKNGDVRVMLYSEFLKEGESTSAEDLKARQDNVKPGQCCALIYTSGTTGRPKAVMVSHDNINFEASGIMSEIRKSCGMGNGGQERIISYLPLSHVAGMMVDIVSPLMVTSQGPGFVTVSFARPYDLSKGTIKDRLQSVSPTIFLGVPRVWEKIADKIRASGRATQGLAKKLAMWAKPKLLQYTKGFNRSGTPCSPFGLSLANVVAKKVKTRLGLTEVKYAFTGAAPIQKHTLEFYGSLGIMINEVYGMSENTGATTISTDQVHEWGSCGWQMPGTEVKILKEGKDGKYEAVPRSKDLFNPTEEEQGEICFRGRHIMMGYLANPDFKGEGGVEQIKKKNESAIDSEGWLHSGDKGTMDQNGFVKITGRYKELIIGAGGENVAPVPIEANVKRLCEAVSNFTMIGDKRPYNVALVTLKCEGATGYEAGTTTLTGAAAGVVPGITTVAQAAREEKYWSVIKDAIIATNNDPSVCPKNAAKVQKFAILPQDFSVATGELTATLKLKRSVVAKKYANVIDAIYKLPRDAVCLVPEGDAEPAEKTESTQGKSETADAGAAEGATTAE